MPDPELQYWRVGGREVGTPLGKGCFGISIWYAASGGLGPAGGLHTASICNKRLVDQSGYFCFKALHSSYKDTVCQSTVSGGLEQLHIQGQGYVKHTEVPNE